MRIPSRFIPVSEGPLRPGARVPLEFPDLHPMGVASMRSYFATMIFGSSLLFSGSAAALGDWELDKQENGIDVYTRPVEGSGIKEFKGIAEVAADAESILQILRDSDGFKDWFPNTSDSRLLARDGNVTHQYSVMETPWPIANRDNVFRSELTRDETTGVIDITVAAEPDFIPVEDGIVRVRKANGNWKLEPIAPDKTRITFTMHLEPGGGIPEWIINARVVASPFEALTNLRGLVAK